MEAYKEKLKKLKELRKQASHASFKEVLEENERFKRPANWEKKLERDAKKIKAEEERQKAEEMGQDYELKKSLEIQADELEKWERIQKNKRRPDPGFIDYEAATKRQYFRLVKQLKPEHTDQDDDGDKNSAEQRLSSGSSTSAQPQSSALVVSDKGAKQSKSSMIKDSKEGVDRMVEDVHKQIEVRSKRSRRRRFDDDADVDYINERNMRFNKKLERFYSDYTEEIKQNFERGTAM